MNKCVAALGYWQQNVGNSTDNWVRHFKKTSSYQDSIWAGQNIIAQLLTKRHHKFWPSSDVQKR